MRELNLPWTKNYAQIVDRNDNVVAVPQFSWQTDFIVKVSNQQASIIETLTNARNWIDQCGAQAGADAIINDIDRLLGYIE